ncbi:DNA internalization-related competence protein ComEC/Rec2 [Anoxybacterium hadale]|uniref:DNA internalization-related competence protein ComEC/Rec2 n=1 Tax=Anoxybacterium hadale TaxID=3408580 RepID=A0ACD1A9Y5_9FIRM|nr:DNA internalization-related competence protein ComEC/Rec2 [Clostridiales bacterium]
MRRPIIFLFLFFIAGIALEYHLEMNLQVLVCSFAILIILLLFPFFTGPLNLRVYCQPIRLACLLSAVFLLGSTILYFAENDRDPLEALEGKKYQVQGRVITVQVKDENSCQVLITAEPYGKRLIQIRGGMASPVELIGKWMVVRGTITIPAERRNPNLFDYRLYLKTRNVRVIIQANSNQITFDESRLALLPSAVARLKYGFTDRLKDHMSPETYGVTVGMLFGDRSYIGEDIYDAFQKNGIAHILSVSGIHVGIVYLYISKLLGNRKTIAFYMLTSGFLIFYAALSEFSPSVVRAAVMIFIHILSKILWRPYDFPSCTAACGLVMLIINPYYLFNTGFQLSFAAVFCLASGLPWTERKLNRLQQEGKPEHFVKLLRFLTPLFVIQLGMAPLTAYLFNYFSVASFFANIPIIALSGVMIPLGISLIPLAFLGELLFGIGARAMELLVELMIWMNDCFYLPGVGFYPVVSPSVYFLILYYGFFFCLTSEMMRVLFQRKNRRGIALICAAIVLLSALSHTIVGSENPDAGLIFLDVGQGDSLHIKTPGGRNVLIDGGGSQNYNVGKNILLPYLLKSGVREIDLAIATHLHDDHYLGLTQLAKGMKIKKFGTYEINRYREEEILEETGLKRENMVYLKAGDRIQLDQDVWIDVLYPKERTAEEYQRILFQEEDENKSSLMMRVTYRGLSVLMTGDIGFDGETELMRQYQADPEQIRADILKVGHHGSKYSTGDHFLESVAPEIAVFQVGKNNFGHPHEAVIEKCSKKGIMIYRNDQNGAIIFETEGQTWHIKVLLPKNMHIKELTEISKAAG